MKKKALKRITKEILTIINGGINAILFILAIMSKQPYSILFFVAAFAWLGINLYVSGKFE